MSESCSILRGAVVRKDFDAALRFIEPSIKREAYQWKRPWRSMEDLIQEARIGAWEGLSDWSAVKPNACPSAFAVRGARSRLFQIHRSEKIPGVDSEKPGETHGNSISYLAEQTILLAQETMDLPGREEFLLHWASGLSLREIGRRNSCNPLTVSRRIRSAEQALGRTLRAAILYLVSEEMLCK